MHKYIFYFDSDQNLVFSRLERRVFIFVFFYFQSARDYMLDREAQIRTTTQHRCPNMTTTKETTGFVVPKESVLRGETTRFQSTPSPNTVTAATSGGGGGESSNGSKLSLVIPFEARSALANSMPALDRLVDNHHCNTTNGNVAMTASLIGVATKTDKNGFGKSTDLVLDRETAEVSLTFDFFTKLQ